jgi:hypothetical protein
MLSSVSIDGIPPGSTLATWDEPSLLPPPRGWITEATRLWESASEIIGARLVIPWDESTRFWMPAKDCLWTSSKNHWYLWRLEQGAWKRIDGGVGTLTALPPKQIGLHATIRGIETRKLSSIHESDWRDIPLEPEWPDVDPAWVWFGEDAAVTAWDLRWGNAPPNLPKERSRDALQTFFKDDWRSSLALRSSLKIWLSNGPEVALREQQNAAWVWCGTKISLVRLPSENRQKRVRELLAG